MSTVMKASEFVKKLKDVANNYKTLYVMGCFGAPMNAANKKRYCNNHEYNMQESRRRHINAASADTFGFDCVCLIKGILWGWKGDKTKTYGGAAYSKQNLSNVPDIGANAMIKKCANVSTDFSKIEVGEAVWCEGHIGVYIGDGLAVECTPKWQNCVQITAVKNIGTKTGFDARTWTKHGFLPYIDYSEPVTEKPEKVKAAQKKDDSLAGSYTVNSVAGLNIRTGPGTKYKSLGVLKLGEVVQNYGYYSMGMPVTSKTKWLYVLTKNGVEGYCSSRYLKKRK